MRKVFTSFLKSSAVKGMLRGMGGAAVAAIGWKLASDLYDVVKQRLKERPVATEEEKEEY